jgi:hypothetical protein
MLRTFAFDFRKLAGPEHPCFYNAMISVLSMRVDTLMALSIGLIHDSCLEGAPPIDFSELRNLEHLRIPVSLFLGSTSNDQSLPDDQMRVRFPASLKKLVLLVDKSQECHILSSLQHYIGADPPIMPNLQELDVCCHAPEAMYAWLHQAAHRHHIHLRIFRKLKTKDDRYFITPFANTVESSKQEISQIKLKLCPPLPDLQLESLMPLEEYEPDTEAIVPIFEEANADGV